MFVLSLIIEISPSCVCGTSEQDPFTYSVHDVMVEPDSLWTETESWMVQSYGVSVIGNEVDAKLFS